MHGGFLYLVVVMDWFSRFVISWEPSNTMETGFCLTEFGAAFRFGQPGIWNSDQASGTAGSQRLRSVGSPSSREIVESLAPMHCSPAFRVCFLARSVAVQGRSWPDNCAKFRNLAPHLGECSVGFSCDDSAPGAHPWAAKQVRPSVLPLLRKSSPKQDQTTANRMDYLIEI